MLWVCSYAPLLDQFLRENNSQNKKYEFKNIKFVLIYIIPVYKQINKPNLTANHPFYGMSLSYEINELLVCYY